ncbi:16S rRNA (cytosine(967)-C(5))-methyltransferase RsmB [Lagierella sp. ICN-221743]
MNERNFSIQVLLNVEQGGYSSELLSKIPKNLNSQLIRQIVLGVIENDIFLEMAILGELDKPDKTLPQEVVTILKVGVYQKFFMNSIPDYAIVSESLNSCEYFKVTQYKGLVNSILRNIDNSTIEEKISNMPSVNDRLKAKYSVSDDFYELLFENYKIKTIRKILKSYVEVPDLVIRVNNLKTSTKELKYELDNLNIEYEEHPFLEDALIIIKASNLFETDIFNNGHFTIQGGASILTSLVLNPEKNSKILDICAAPGGKTCHLAEIVSNTGEFLANDLHEQKIEKIKENAKRLGCKNIEYSNFDGVLFKENLVNSFDYILLDAPCSGSGIVSRNPEIKLRRTKSELEKLIITQREIMDNCLKYLKVGGYLVYSTCSIFKQENEMQREYFLDRYENIKPVNFNYRDNNISYLSLMPYEKGTDGFFISKFQKTSN